LGAWLVQNVLLIVDSWTRQPPRFTLVDFVVVQLKDEGLHGVVGVWERERRRAFRVRRERCMVAAMKMNGLGF
jgi:hypothetical protein